MTGSDIVSDMPVIPALATKRKLLLEVVLDERKTSFQEIFAVLCLHILGRPKLTLVPISTHDQGLGLQCVIGETNKTTSNSAGELY